MRSYCNLIDFMKQTKSKFMNEWIDTVRDTNTTTRTTTRSCCCTHHTKCKSFFFICMYDGNEYNTNQWFYETHMNGQFDVNEKYQMKKSIAFYMHRRIFTSFWAITRNFSIPKQLMLVETHYSLWTWNFPFQYSTFFIAFLLFSSLNVVPLLYRLSLATFRVILLPL